MASVLLVSTYELGRQPLGVAGPAGVLLAAGHEVRAVDLAVDAWDPAALEGVDAVSISVPMHTATRLALDVVAAVRSSRPEVAVAAHGLYAGLLDGVVDPGAALAAEDPRAVADWLDPVTPLPADPVPPARHLLPPLERYARFDRRGDGADLGLAAAVEATRGCNHRCRHCPVPVLWDGRSRPVGEEAVLADVAAVVAAGATHVTFADPDFLNRPPVARRVVDALHGAFPELTWDATVKVEHVLAHAGVWPEWAAKGCRFVVSAFETFDDAVLAVLDKGHTAAQAAAATTVLRDAGVAVRPSLLPFTPWTTWPSLVALTDAVIDLDLVGALDAVQFGIRLLLPPGSLALDRLPPLPYDAAALGHVWHHDDPALEALAQELAAMAEAGAGVGEVITRIRAAAGAPARAVPAPAPGPRLTESWFCCAEPTPAQRASLGGLRST